ncbi:hypothetical protein WMF26_11350 [Sorangium sp. So ce185]|uniref:Hint domain-containing protein n=1 Tax=Sorangium sp. So ce185 TaxID=3133287 RepID=UPI003F5FCFC0
MPTYPEYQQRFARDLTAGIDAAADGRRAPAAAGDPDLSRRVDALVDALPYYGDMAMEAVHRGALANLLAVYLPNNAVAPHPDESGPWYAYYLSIYYYRGPYSGYRDAFYGGVGQSSLAGLILAKVQASQSSLNPSWWGSFGVTVLTDGVRREVSVSLDGGKLSTDLDNGNSAFRGALTASYLPVLTSGYASTASAFAAIVSAGQSGAAATLLDQAISRGQFTADINQALAMGGDSANAATWFLYNLWVVLDALGLPDVDGAITRYQQNGLQVPAEVQAVSWRSGGYTSWFPALTGADVLPQASAGIAASMPEEKMTTYTGSSYPSVTYPSESNGYAVSLTQWGSLNWYVPHDSGCCFSAGTQVLMADGSTQGIETIENGDLLATDRGPRRVVLVEKPPRGTRTLHRINDLDLWATDGHPFRCASTAGPRIAAAEPWTLIDGLPTITEKGVCRLRPGVVLAARQGTRDVALDVVRVDSSPANPEDAQRTVYDLLVEGWERDRVAYYVGGPEVFVAVEPESVDPTQSLAVTRAVVTTLEMIVPPARGLIGHPHAEFPRLLRHVDRSRARAQALSAYRVYRGGKPLPPASPVGPGCLLQQGDWDPHASALEYYIVRDFGRFLRSHAAQGWRVAPEGDPLGDRLVLGLADLELLDTPLPAGPRPAVDACLRSLRFDGLQTPRTLELEPSARLVWNVRLDKSLDLGPADAIAPGAVVDGWIRSGNAVFARFRVAVTPGLARPGEVHDAYLFAPDGRVIGRLGLDLRLISTAHLEAEASAREAWKPEHELLLAHCLGEQIGHLLLPHLKACASI